MIRYPYQGTSFDGWQNKLTSYAPGFLLKLYRDMLRIRIIEEEVERHYFQDHMKPPIHLVIGQEATSVGACAALTRADLLYTSHQLFS